MIRVVADLVLTRISGEDGLTSDGKKFGGKAQENQNTTGQAASTIMRGKACANHATS